jgi:hypothetical protein
MNLYFFFAFDLSESSFLYPTPCISIHFSYYTRGSIPGMASHYSVRLHLQVSDGVQQIIFPAGTKVTFAEGKAVGMRS